MTDSKFDCLDTHKVYLSFQTVFVYKGLKLTDIFYWMMLLINYFALASVVGVNHWSVFQDKENSNHFHFLSHFSCEKYNWVIGLFSSQWNKCFAKFCY